MSHNRYSLKEHQLLNGSVRLLNAASAKYGEDWHSVPHTHKFAELFYVISGRGEFQIEQDSYPVMPKQLVVVNPNVQHTEVSYKESPLEYLVLGIEGLELVGEEESRFRILDPSESSGIPTCMQNILIETNSGLAGSDVVCQAYMEILLVRLMRHIRFLVNDTPLPTSSRQCAVVRRYIDAHFKESMTLDELAEIAHLNKYYLAHLFKEEYGVSPINYQLERRIEESCALLTQTDMSLAQISRVLGFSSSSYFSQIFRRSKQVSPSQYRSLHMGNSES